MMQSVQDLELHNFFNISEFSHALLFEGCIFPWEAIERLSEYLSKLDLGEVQSAIPSSVHLVQPSLISIGKDTVIEAGAYIEGPCVIGDRCVIRNGAYIRGNALIGNRCVIGHGSEIKNAILMDGAKAPHFNYIGDSILGNGVNVGAGVKCANFRLDGAEITISAHGKKWKTGLKKLGAIIGDGANVGCNCVLNPGTLLGKNALCFPCLNVSGVVPNHAKVKSAQKNIVEF